MRPPANRPKSSLWLEWGIPFLAASLSMLTGYLTAIAVSAVVHVVYPSVDMLKLSVTITIYPLFFVFRPIYSQVCFWFRVQPYEDEEPGDVQSAESPSRNADGSWVAYNPTYDDE